MEIASIAKIINDCGVMPAAFIILVMQLNKTIDRQCTSLEAITKDISVIKEGIAVVKNNIEDIKGKIK